MKCFLVGVMMSWAVTLFAQEWPCEITSSEGVITIYQPQIASYKETAMSARTAISILPTGKDKQVFGAVWLDCRVSTDRTNRTVALVDVKVKQIKFPNESDEETAKITAALEDQLPRMDLTFSLDFLLESLETAQKERETARDLDVTPPRIIVMNHPAVLVLIDGDPIVTDVEGTSLNRVTNTPYFIVQVPSSRRYYLRGGTVWYSALDVLGPWSVTNNPPKAVVDLSQQFLSDDASDEELDTSDPKLKTGTVPEIVVSTEPAELIATDGDIQLAPIEGTGLLYASNTPSRVFLEIATQQYYILISGRWYTAKSLTGPWVNVESKKLPADFAKIPPGSERDDVLASVAGTVPAKEAILDAQIPQTAEVDRATATTDVQYDGDPQFDPIDSTSMEYAVNSPTPVIRTGGRYYACQNGVWFDAAAAFGPWGVCVNIPEVIYTIPPRCPVYNVRYVRVYSYTSSVAFVGYTAGYTGCYVHGGTVVYGTGYHYRSWFKHNYFARPSTWGFGVHYDPWTGWAFSASVGWGRPHGWFAYNTKTVSAGWWGPEGFRPLYHPAVHAAYRQGYHPAIRQVVPPAPAKPVTTGNNRGSGATRTTTIYGRWNAGVNRPTVPPVRTPTRPTARPVQLPATLPENPPAVRTETRMPREAARGNVRITPTPSTKENNVYAAPDGNVLRKTPQGWQQRDQSTWKPAGQVVTTQGIDRDQQVRQRAAERASGFQRLPTATPIQKAQPAAKPPAARNPAPERKKDEKKR